MAAALLKELVRLQRGSAEMKDAVLTVGGVAADDAQARAVRAGLRAAVGSSFKLTDQIRVHKPKTEAKPPAEPRASTPPAEREVKAAAPAGREAKLAAPAPMAGPATKVPASEPEAKVAAPASEPEAKVAAPAPASEREAKVAAPAASEPEKVAAAPAPAAKAAPAPAEPQPADADPEPAAPGPKTAAAPDAVPAPPANVCPDDLDGIARSGHILFDTDSASLDEASFETLDRLAAAAKRCPGVRVAVEGHADVEGTAEYNQRLSLRRAEAVVAYLIKAGADASQLKAVGFGASRPAAPNDSLANKARNRRIEIVVRR
jgi:outer membrane protein OmpA-like peptidoglycan-associated protein